MNLQSLRNGDVAHIESMTGCQREIASLGAMGICSGAEIEIVRCGSPCILRVDGCRLCVRPSAETSITVNQRQEQNKEQLQPQKRAQKQLQPEPQLQIF